MEMLMRFVLALLLATAAVGPVAAQQAKPVQTKPAQSGKGVQPSQPSPAPQPSQSSKPSSPEEVMRQRILLRERFNKGWDIHPETPQERERRCKREARKHYSALHPFKRRKFAKECMAHAKP
jgi:hypothetical protein